MTPWHHNRRFFACHCGARDETLDGSAVTTCWGCGKAVEEWTPPAVKRERAE